MRTAYPVLVRAGAVATQQAGPVPWRLLVAARAAGILTGVGGHVAGSRRHRPQPVTERVGSSKAEMTLSPILCGWQSRLPGGWQRADHLLLRAVGCWRKPDRGKRSGDGTELPGPDYDPASQEARSAQDGLLPCNPHWVARARWPASGAVASVRGPVAVTGARERMRRVGGAGGAVWALACGRSANSRDRQHLPARCLFTGRGSHLDHPRPVIPVMAAGPVITVLNRRGPGLRAACSPG